MTFKWKNILKGFAMGTSDLVQESVEVPLLYF